MIFDNLKVGDIVDAELDNYCGERLVVEDVKVIEIAHDGSGEVRLSLAPNYYPDKWPANDKWWVGNDSGELRDGLGRILRLKSETKASSHSHSAPSSSEDTDDIFYRERKDKAMEGIDPTTGETLASQKRGDGGMRFL